MDNDAQELWIYTLLSGAEEANAVVKFTLKSPPIHQYFPKSKYNSSPPPLKYIQNRDIVSTISTIITYCILW